MGIEKYDYFSAETYTTLGAGASYPVGDLRLLTCLEPLLGLLLMAGSASHPYVVVQRAVV